MSAKTAFTLAILFAIICIIDTIKKHKKDSILTQKKYITPIKNYKEHVFRKTVEYTIAPIKFDPLYTHILVYKDNLIDVKALLNGQAIDEPMTDGRILLKCRDQLAEAAVYNGYIRFELVMPKLTHIPENTTLGLARKLEDRLYTKALG